MTQRHQKYRAGGVAQVVEHETLSSNLTTAKKKEKE
jgi:hypothetical protein